MARSKSYRIDVFNGDSSDGIQHGGYATVDAGQNPSETIRKAVFGSFPDTKDFTITPVSNREYRRVQNERRLNDLAITMIRHTEKTAQNSLDF